MDNKIHEAFNAIVEFVNDLWIVFGDPKRSSPLALYRRLISHIKPTDVDAIDKILYGFKIFLTTYDDAILNNKLDLIPRGVTIQYSRSKAAFLEIQKYIYKTKNEPDTRETIRIHLVTISAILEPSEKKLSELDKKIEDLTKGLNNKESEFISNIMTKAKDSFSDENMGTDPTQAILGLFSSGVIQDMVVGMQHGVSSGELDMHRLLGSMQNMLGNIIPPQSAPVSPNPIHTPSIESSPITEVKDID